ncbi:hypothetical protein Goshw_003038 [Gossypium schwendimanii]|uniref:Uncharacterized protein n=1 Tax=Gossypium schwendimanii TaxID=34291 RepID=A0A7J9MG44_GOSSC|nr:hypothetical protein [Gossypium schwendimanii]
MGPIKGFKRRKKTADKKVVDHNVLPSSLGSQSQPLDWWDEFSNRISVCIRALSACDVTLFTGSVRQLFVMTGIVFLRT